MSEWIRREDALAALRERLEKLYGANAPYTRWNDLKAFFAGGLDEAVKIVRALPAIGTCKDCANSGCRPDWRGFIECLLGERQAGAPLEVVSRGCYPDHLFVHPDHFCAAWRAKA